MLLSEVHGIVRKYARLIVNVLMNRSFTWNEINLKCRCGRFELSMLIKLLNMLTCILLFSLLLISSHFIIADSNVGCCSFFISTEYARSVFFLVITVMNGKNQYFTKFFSSTNIEMIYWKFKQEWFSEFRCLSMNKAICMQRICAIVAGKDDLNIVQNHSRRCISRACLCL